MGHVIGCINPLYLLPHCRSAVAGCASCSASPPPSLIDCDTSSHCKLKEASTVCPLKAWLVWCLRFACYAYKFAVTVITVQSYLIGDLTHPWNQPWSVACRVPDPYHRSCPLQFTNWTSTISLQSSIARNKLCLNLQNDRKVLLTQSLHTFLTFDCSRVIVATGHIT